MSTTIDNDPDIGMCDWCGSDEGKRRQTSRGWTCAECSESIR